MGRECTALLSNERLHPCDLNRYEPENSSKYFHKRLFSDGTGQGPSAFLLDVVLPFILVCQLVNWQRSQSRSCLIVSLKPAKQRTKNDA